MERWKTVGRRPGFLGTRRNLQYDEWNRKHGFGNWRLVWEVNGNVYDWLGACVLYEDAYFEFMKGHPEIVDRLVREAREVYDDEPTNVNSGLDYTKQETIRTHIQDITIRRCLVRLGKWFRGTEPIRIRHSKGDHPLSMILSPGCVPFHRPEWIWKPELTGWWNPGTVEAFYQSNKVLQVRKTNP